MSPSPSPLLFEALPPKLESDDEQWQDHLDLLHPLRQAGLAAVNVPEVVNGHYQTVSPRAFAAALQRHLGVRAIVNRITVHHTAPALQGWAAETRQGAGIKDFVLVGGESSKERYPGIGVGQALEALRPATERAGGTLGVITIAHRRRADHDEPQRLVAKQQAGARFAVSQILCRPEDAVALQRDYAAVAPAGRTPLTLFWSLAPVARQRDVEFLKWLGVQVPPDVETRLLEPGSPTGRLAASHALNEGLARALLEAAERDGTPTPGFCLEHVMMGNIEAAIELVERVRSITKEFGGLPKASPLAKAW